MTGLDTKRLLGNAGLHVDCELLPDSGGLFILDVGGRTTLDAHVRRLKK